MLDMRHPIVISSLKEDLQVLGLWSKEDEPVQSDRLNESDSETMSEEVKAFSESFDKGWDDMDEEEEVCLSKKEMKELDSMAEEITLMGEMDDEEDDDEEDDEEGDDEEDDYEESVNVNVVAETIEIIESLARGERVTVEDSISAFGKIALIASGLHEAHSQLFENDSYRDRLSEIAREAADAVEVLKGEDEGYKRENIEAVIHEHLSDLTPCLGAIAELVEGN